jgi:hypothetical protein
MSISIQTLHDVFFALAVTVGIAVALSIAFIAAGALFERDEAHAAKAARPGAIPAQHPAPTADTRVLVER